MTPEQQEARTLLQRERAKAGLPTDIDALIEYYRELDPKYAKCLEEAVGPSEKKSQGK